LNAPKFFETERQYALVDRAIELGWSRDQVTIIDEDLKLSGAGTVKRAGFARLAADVALAKVGIVFGLEVTRVAARRLADPPKMGPRPEGFGRAVTLPAASVATGVHRRTPARPA
jgi:hypothetical protein